MKNITVAILVVTAIALLSGCDDQSSTNVITCNSTLTQSLFYSMLLKKDDDLKQLAQEVKRASTLPEINKLVTSGSNIDAKRTRWYRASDDASKCEAQIYLQTPNSDGNNTTYVDFSISGYVPMDDDRSDVLESMHVNWFSMHWFKG